MRHAQVQSTFILILMKLQQEQSNTPNGMQQCSSLKFVPLLFRMLLSTAADPNTCPVDYTRPEYIFIVSAF